MAPFTLPAFLKEVPGVLSDSHLPPVWPQPSQGRGPMKAESCVDTTWEEEEEKPARAGRAYHVFRSSPCLIKTLGAEG